MKAVCAAPAQYVDKDTGMCVGCADGKLRQVAEDVRRERRSQRVRVDLGSDEAYEFGMTCAGQAEVLLWPMSPADPVWQAAARRQRRGGSGGRVRHVFCRLVLQRRSNLFFGSRLHTRFFTPGVVHSRVARAEVE